MLDSADSNLKGRGGSTGNGRPCRDEAGGRRGFRRCALEALVMARGIVLVFLMPFQIGVWLSEWLEKSAYSRPLVVVVAALAGICLSFIGLIGVLKLAATDHKRDQRVRDGAKVVECVAPGGTEPLPAVRPAEPATGDAGTVERPRLLSLGVAAVIIVTAYALAGCSGSMLPSPDWLAYCAAESPGSATSLASLAWQVSVPLLLIEMLWSALSG
jgi:hypothetical protein